MCGNGTTEDDVFSVQIRPDWFVRFAGIPVDLTKSEACKIANVILALAFPESDQEGK